MMDLYYHPASPNSRAVLITAAALNVKLNLKQLDLQKKEHLTPEFIKLNPQHTIPTLVDNGFSIWESRAIAIYLIEKYGKDDSLFPKDPQTRAIINQRLYFEMGSVLKFYYDYYLASFYGKKSDPEDLKKLNEGLGHLNTFLTPTGYAVGKHLTVADIVLYSTVSTLTVFDFDFTPYPEVKKWLEMLDRKIPGVEINNKGLEIMRSFVKSVNLKHFDFEL